MFIALLGAIILSAGQAVPPVTFGDRAGSEAATQAYREAWLSNHPQRIMNTLTPDRSWLIWKRMWGDLR